MRVSEAPKPVGEIKLKSYGYQFLTVGALRLRDCTVLDKSTTRHLIHLALIQRY